MSTSTSAQPLDGKVGPYHRNRRSSRPRPAVLFAEREARVAGVDIDAAGNEQTATLVREPGGEMLAATRKGDISTPHGAPERVAAAVAAFGRVDVLYDNASAPRFGGPDQITPRTGPSPTSTTSTSSGFPLRRLGRTSSRRAAAASSTPGPSPACGESASCPSCRTAPPKGAVLSMTYHLAAAGGPHRIWANAILPGLTRSPATAALFATPEAPGARFVAENPLGRRRARGRRAGGRLPRL